MSPINYNVNTDKIAVPMNQMLEYIPLRSGSKRGITLADQAYEHTLKEILFPEEGGTHEIEYGGKITESTLAKALKMSNGPVREAIFRLRQESWIRTVGNKGSFLVDFSDPEIANEIYMFRLSFETGAFYSLAASVTTEQIAVLKKILDVIEKAIAESDADSFRKADISFHLQVVEFSGGKMFRQIFRSKLLQWYAMAFHVLMKSMGAEHFSHSLEAAGTSSHRDLFEAIRSHDSEWAARLITEHYNYLAHLLGINKGKTGNVA